MRRDKLDDAPQLLDGETEADRLRAALEAAETDRRLQDDALARLQGELAGARGEVAGTRGEAVHQRGLVKRALAEIDTISARLAELAATRDAESARLHAEIALLNRGIADLSHQNAALMASFSWRVTRPVRFASWRVKLLRARLRPPAPPVVAPPPPPPADPNAAYTFTPSSTPGDRHGPLTLDGLHHLSRSL